MKRLDEKEPSMLENYKLINRLGSGSQGTVWKATRKDGKIIALKILNTTPGQKSYDTAINEVTLLEKISYPQCNPYLACYYNHSYDPHNKNFLIEMEYIDGQTLNIYGYTFFIQQNYNQLYTNLLLITKYILTGLSFVHKNGIIHNDIKPENIIIDKNGIPKLVDFGVACLTTGDESDICKHGRKNIDCCEGFSGTPKYATPEMISNRVRYPQSDIWSLGVTLYHIASGARYPFDYKNVKTIWDIFDITKEQIPRQLTTQNKLLNNIVNKSLIKDPFKRITTEGILYLLGNV